MFLGSEIPVGSASPKGEESCARDLGRHDVLTLEARPSAMARVSTAWLAGCRRRSTAHRVRGLVVALTGVIALLALASQADAWGALIGGAAGALIGVPFLPVAISRVVIWAPADFRTGLRHLSGIASAIHGRSVRASVQAVRERTVNGVVGGERRGADRRRRATFWTVPTALPGRRGGLACAVISRARAGPHG